jgi:hypothetical protein
MENDGVACGAVLFLKHLNTAILHLKSILSPITLHHTRDGGFVPFSLNHPPASSSNDLTAELKKLSFQMDPLSITAAVLALATAAVQVTHILKTVISQDREAPQVVERALREVQDFSTTITSIKSLLDNLEAAHKDRLSLIEVEPLVVTLTDAGLTFFEFNRVLAGIKCNELSSLIVKFRFRWAGTQITLKRLAENVNRHKVSLSLTLSVIQWYVSF